MRTSYASNDVFSNATNRGPVRVCDVSRRATLVLRPPRSERSPRSCRLPATRAVLLGRGVVAGRADQLRPGLEAVPPGTNEVVRGLSSRVRVCGAFLRGIDAVGDREPEGLGALTSQTAEGIWAVRKALYRPEVTSANLRAGNGLDHGLGLGRTRSIVLLTGGLCVRVAPGEPQPVRPRVERRLADTLLHAARRQARRPIGCIRARWKFRAPAAWRTSSAMRQRPSSRVNRWRYLPQSSLSGDPSTYSCHA
jgi:hypothetical protein